MLRQARLPVVVVLGLVFVTLVGIQIEPAASNSESGCEPIGGVSPRAERTTASDSSSGPEITQYFDGGSYEVTRCNPDGQVQVSQLVGPLVVPGGETTLVPYRTTRLKGDYYESLSPLYGDPNEAVWTEEWGKHGDEIENSVLPPTAGDE